MGPLAGIKVVEIGALGPAPVAGMLLADLGAEVVLIERTRSDSMLSPGKDRSHSAKAFFNRGKKSITLDLKEPDSIEIALKLISRSDALIEGFRPGVMERLGLGPDECFAINSRLVYGRLTGWGQDGPLAKAAGHDLNYIALTGALFYSGHKDESPFAPPTYVGDIGGGAFVLALGVVSALLHVRAGGTGQVIDTAITDGTATMSTLLLSLHQMGLWTNNRADNILDSAAPWYDTYECADGKHVTIAALEPQFYKILIELLGLGEEPDFTDQMDRSKWPSAKLKMAQLFKSKTRGEWCELLEGTNACFAPVLNFEEARVHPHNAARKTFIDPGGILQPAPAPRFSWTDLAIQSP
ncbi:MAG: CoA transferase, partial [Proteobacteria bacterium]|nr:CoA transferase [Pseudomonadota bacterium]